MKILILTASTGGGHKRASSALEHYINSTKEDAKVLVVDSLEYCGKTFNKAVSEGYHYLATKTPKIYGKAYRMADNDNIINTFVEKVNAQMSRRLLPLITKFKPDVIVTVHPFAAKMAGVLKGKEYINMPVIAIITDFAGHRAYIDDNVDEYVVATDAMIEELSIKYKVKEDRINSLGIPIYNSFYTPPDIDEINKSIGFSKKIPTILIMAGSFGVTDILEIYENLIDLKTKYQIIVITGKNKRLYKAFKENIKESLKIGNPYKPTKLFYFINNVQDYMHISDLIITKPGGLTVSESLATGLPLAIFNAIPGQEEDNAEYLTSHGMAIAIEKGRTGALQIEDLIKEPETLEEMRDNCNKFSKKQAAENIYSLIKYAVNKYKETTAY